jgi:hypothetical protein
MDEDGPGLSNAFGGAPPTPSAASWNPALRSEKEVALPVSAKPPTHAVPESSEDEEEDDEEDDEEESEDEESEDEEQAPSVPVPAVAAAPAPAPTEEDSSEEEESDDDAPAPTSTTQAPQSAQQTQRTAREEGGEDALVSATQALNIEEQPVAHAKAASSDEEGSEEEDSEGESSEEETEHPEENYEHQGETTALEEAMTESVKVPLVADTEADEWGGSGDDAFDLGGQAQEPPLETPLAEAVGTTVGDDNIGNTTVGGNTGEDIDWGNTEEQEDFFGAGASQTIEPAQSVDQTPGAHVVPSESKPAEKSEWDLDLDLDDDFLPEQEDAPVLELSDDEGFLEDEPPVSEQQPAQPTPPGIATASGYAPQTAPVAPANTPAANSYAPKAPAAPAYNGSGQNVGYQQQQARPPMAASAQSFADKAKGGYASPYDLPEDIVTTRKRPAPRTAVSAVQPTPPPPRTSSMSSNAGPPRPPFSTSMSVSSMSPPSSGHSMRAQMIGMPPPAAPPKPAVTANSPSSDFFAELPVTSKPRPSGRYTPQPNVSAQPPVQHAPPQLPPKERTASWSSLRNEVLPDAANVPTPPPFRQPEQLPMFPTQPSVPARTNSLPVPQQASAQPSGRYSPAPPPSGAAANAPPQGAQGQPHARYASEPHNTLTRTPSQPFAPRTSSPLAFHSMPQQQAHIPEANAQYAPNHHVTQSADGMPRPPFKSPLGELSEMEEQEPALSSRPPTSGRSETPPPPRSTTSSAVGSPRKREMRPVTNQRIQQPHHALIRNLRQRL